MSVSRVIEILERHLPGEVFREFKKLELKQNSTDEIEGVGYSIWKVADPVQLQQTYKRRLRTSFGSRIDWLRKSVKMLEKNEVSCGNQFWCGYVTGGETHYDFLVDIKRNHANIFENPSVTS